jgi:hypothetical protein
MSNVSIPASRALSEPERQQAITLAAVLVKVLDGRAPLEVERHILDAADWLLTPAGERRQHRGMWMKRAMLLHIADAQAAQS